MGIIKTPPVKEIHNPGLSVLNWGFLLYRLDAFLSALGVLFDDPDVATSAAAHLRALRQGQRTAEECSEEFRRWVTVSDWNDSALHSQYRLGLSEGVKDAMVQFPPCDSLSSLNSQAINIHRHIRARRSEREVEVCPSGEAVSSSDVEVEHIQIVPLMCTQRILTR